MLIWSIPFRSGDSCCDGCVLDTQLADYAANNLILCDRSVGSVGWWSVCFILCTWRWRDDVAFLGGVGRDLVTGSFDDLPWPWTSLDKHTQNRPAKSTKVVKDKWLWVPSCRVDNVCDGWGSFETSWQCFEVGLGFSSSTYNIVALALFQTTKIYRKAHMPPKWKDTLGVSLASYLRVSLWLDVIVTTCASFLGAFTVRGSSRGNERTFYVEFVIWGTFLPSIDDYQHLAPFFIVFSFYFTCSGGGMHDRPCVCLI